MISSRIFNMNYVIITELISQFDKYLVNICKIKRSLNHQLSSYSETLLN